jgi:methenyltetrahydrofolate cyclohydrolase
MASLSESSMSAIAEQVASTAPAPGAGPSAAWTCALAASLVEMVSGVELAKDPADPDTVRGRRDRAAALRTRALELADADIAAYSAVLEERRHRKEKGHSGHLREALSAAADPPLQIVEVAAEVARLGADATAESHGAVRGEAFTAVILAEAVARAGLPLVDLNLGGVPADPRHAQVRELADGARAALERALAAEPGRRLQAPGRVSGGS